MDLGRDESNRLVLTYLRCVRGTSRCTAFRDDLSGNRRSYRGIARKRCTLTTAPSVWRSQIAYGQQCRTRANRPDGARSAFPGIGVVAHDFSPAAPPPAC